MIKREYDCFKDSYKLAHYVLSPTIFFFTVSMSCVQDVNGYTVKYTCRKYLSDVHSAAYSEKLDGNLVAPAS